jgi:Mor family transcriptional regulator
MSFVRDLIDQTVRALGTSLPEDRLCRLEQSVMSQIQARYSGETVRLYVPKEATVDRAEKARRIRAAWNGKNAALLATQFRVSRRTVYRIVGVKGVTGSD